MNLLLLFPTVWSWLITVRAWNRKRIKCVLIEPDHSTFSCQGDCKYDVVGGKVGGRTLRIISTACKLNGSLETAHSVYIVKSIIWQRPVTGGHIHNPVSYDIADIHSVLLSVFSVLYHDVGPRKTHLNMKYYLQPALTDASGWQMSFTSINAHSFPLAAASNWLRHSS